MHLISKRTTGRGGRRIEINRNCVVVVEDNSDGSLGDSSLPLLVHELLQITNTHLTQIADAQNKANSIKNVTLARAIQASNCVELRIKAAYDRALGVALEPIDNDFLDEHFCTNFSYME